MAVKNLIKHLDKAFVKQDRGLPPFVEKVLGGVEAWLHAENSEIEVPSFRINSQDLRLRKASLFLAGLAKRVSYCSLVKRGDDRGIILQEFSLGKSVSTEKRFLSLPPLDLDRTFSIAVNKLPIASYRTDLKFSDKKAQLMNIDEDYSLLVLCDLPDLQKRALLSLVGESIKKIRL